MEKQSVDVEIVTKISKKLDIFRNLRYNENVGSYTHKGGSLLWILNLLKRI